MPWPKGKPFPPEMVAKRIASLQARGTRRKKPRIEDGVELWLCPACEAWKPASEFYPSKRMSNGLKSECKPCHGRISFETRNKDNARRANRAFMQRARQSDPDKFREREREYSKKRPRDERYRARVLLNSAVRAGRVIRPEHCSNCGRQTKVTGHHPDYSKPLEVIWLCYECHANK